MDIDINDIDFDRLRDDLIDYFGSATSFYSKAWADVINVDSCTDMELLNLIDQSNLDIDNYIKYMK